MNKILLVHNIPSPYRIPLFNELNNQLIDKGYVFKVIFGGLGYSRRKWKINMNDCAFNYEVLNSTTIKLGNNEKTLFLYSRLLKTVRKEKPDIIICTGFSIATLKVWLYSFYKPIKLLVWSGSINTKGRKDSILRKVFRKILMLRIDGYLAYGNKAKEYLLAFGIRDNKISIAINTTQVEFFHEEVEKISKSKSIINETFQFLYVGYLTRLKRLDLIFHALKVLAKQRNDFVFNIVGDGGYINELKRLVNDLSIEKVVVFHGFKQKPEIPYYLANADCFLFPSDYDIWGLVLVEAMAAGIPCISSIHSGATHDLIKHEKTGFKIEFRETDEVVKLMNFVIDNPRLRKQIGDEGKKYVLNNLTYEIATNGFIEAIQKISK